MTTVDAGRLSMTEVDPRVDPSWAELVAGPAGSVFTSPAWIRVLCDTYPGFTPQAHIVSVDGAPVSGVASIVIDDVLGRRIVSLPFSDYADPVLGDPDHHRLLLEHLCGGSDPVRVRTLGAPEATGIGELDAAGEVAWHAIDLDAGADELWDRLRGSSRRNIRKALANGIEVIVSSELDAMHRFYDLHVGVRTRKYRLLPQPRDFFTNIHRQFAPRDGVHVALARHAGRDLAGIVLLEWGDVAYYKFNASSADELVLRPNDLLMWECMRFAQDRGRRSLDLGISDLDQEGLVRYKQKFAGREGRVKGFGTPAPMSDEIAGVRTTFSELTALLTDPDLPDRVAVEAGRLLYRYFT